MYIYLIYWPFRERGRERERNISLLFHLFMHSLVNSCMCPDGEWNPQPCCIGITLQPSELPNQAYYIFLMYWFERETLICWCTYLHIHWSVLVCALTRDQSCNLGVSGWLSNQQLTSQAPDNFWGHLGCCTCCHSPRMLKRQSLQSFDELHSLYIS